MKYFTPGMSMKEAKAIWRKMAATLHPDVGGDETEFKLLSNEYAKIRAGYMEMQLETLESMRERNQVLAQCVADTLNEIYPRATVNVWYGITDLEVEIIGNVPFKKVIDIADNVTALTGTTPVRFTFQRASIKKKIALDIMGSVVYVNCTREDNINRDEDSALYTGRRYHVFQNKKFAICRDLVESRTYILKRSPKINILELFNLESKNSLPK